MDAVDESPVERAILVFQLSLDDRNGRTADDQHRVAVLQRVIDEMLEDWGCVWYLFEQIRQFIL
ncbi:MAG: hypothetical protein IKP18_03650 [Candidatus Methanomethylophilaceae archaeon]|nr:hypothetical protein [Candidatus Methanomethylophilaceae archaeon]